MFIARIILAIMLAVPGISSASRAIFYQPQVRDLDVRPENWPTIFQSVRNRGIDTLIVQWTSYGDVLNKNDTQQWLKSSEPVSKVLFDPKIHLIHNALGTHSQVSRVQGGKLKSKNEIRVASLLKQLPLPILKMVVVHELAHLREKDHNKAFYQLCQYMEPQYHQLELDLRLFLTWRDSTAGV